MENLELTLLCSVRFVRNERDRRADWMAYCASIQHTCNQVKDYGLYYACRTMGLLLEFLVSGPAIDAINNVAALLILTCLWCGSVLVNVLAIDFLVWANP